MPRISRRLLLTAAAAVGLTLTAPDVSAQTSRVAATAVDLSSAIEATARTVAPAVVGDLHDILRSGRRRRATVGRSRDDQARVGLRRRRRSERLHHHQRTRRPGCAAPVRGAVTASGGTLDTWHPGRRLIGQVVGLDLETDLAVVKVDAQGLPALALADSDDLQPGQVVLACGSPLGLHNSVSLGVISAVARQLEPESPMIYVQTDASISPGSSGGPLVDLRGRIVGINTLKVGQASGDDGLGFAAPSNIVRTVYEQIRKSGRVRRGDIGVKAQTVTPDMAAGLGLPRDHGVIVADVRPGSMAAKAGLERGDLVTALDGKPMENGRQLQVSLYRHVVGDVVTLEVVRDGRTMKVPVAMAERQDALGSLTDAADIRQNLVPRLGVLGLTVDAQVADVLPWLRVRGGVVVVSLVEGAIDARDGGLAPGDVDLHAEPDAGGRALRAAPCAGRAAGR